jgi:predicted MFS family arabinose efflux permease
MVAGPGMALLFPPEPETSADRTARAGGMSNLLTAAAPNFALVVVAQLVLGAAIAGTWAMTLAVASHLVPAQQLGRAMAVINIGVAGATADVPLGALISSIAGWRSVFYAVAAATAVRGRRAARLSSIPPASTTVGHDSRLVTTPCCLSRWRSRAAITQVRSMQTATAQDIGPDWPCSAAASRMWVNDPAEVLNLSVL